MIHEEICTYEVCKVAKEKGFNCEVYNYYQATKYYCESLRGIELHSECWKLETDECYSRYNKGSEDIVSAPTQSLLQRWLRENKEVEVYVRHFEETNKYPHHFGVIITDNKGEVLEIGAKMFDTYELALEDALKYALENLV